MGIMIIPFVSSLSDDVINAVPQSMRDGSYALGATQSETIRRVICRPRCRASSAACCWPSRAPSARP
jgi:ABC-type phosphate transport system permease subunit